MKLEEFLVNAAEEAKTFGSVSFDLFSEEEMEMAAKAISGLGLRMFVWFPSMCAEICTQKYFDANFTDNRSAKWRRLVEIQKSTDQEIPETVRERLENERHQLACELVGK